MDPKEAVGRRDPLWAEATSPGRVLCSPSTRHWQNTNPKRKILRISGQQLQSVKPQDPVQLHLSHALDTEVSCSALLKCEYPSMEKRDALLSRAVIQKLVECMSLLQGMGKKLDNEESNCSLYKCSSRVPFSGSSPDVCHGDFGLYPVDRESGTIPHFLSGGVT